MYHGIMPHRWQEPRRSCTRMAAQGENSDMKFTRWRIPVLWFLLLYVIVSAAIAWLPEQPERDTGLSGLVQATRTAQYTVGPRLAAWIVLPTNTPHRGLGALPVGARPTAPAEALASPATPIQISVADPRLETPELEAPTVNGSPTPRPSSSPIPSVTPEPTLTTHIVASGDTLSGIAKKYGVTVQALVEANMLSNPDLLQIGQALAIPVRQMVPVTGSPTP